MRRDETLLGQMALLKVSRILDLVVSGAAMRIIGAFLNHHVTLVRHHIRSQYSYRALLYGHW